MKFKIFLKIILILIMRRLNNLMNIVPEQFEIQAEAEFVSLAVEYSLLELAEG